MAKEGSMIGGHRWATDYYWWYHRESQRWDYIRCVMVGKVSPEIVHHEGGHRHRLNGSQRLI
ncbi:hypothetical protein C4D60_Mb08t12450 [Musa balbisiana]|uniref:Uncharacterized protein n=1 Tax=Musa balbisiana TaxID=52838 RepID=A0A4S8K3A3_MUSBA|nr:hypothetical protein C4D60_Mb08t12450 [Musa balbisiana]